MANFIWPVVTEGLFSLPLVGVDVCFGRVRVCATPCPVSWMVFVLDSEPSCADRLLESRWVQVAPLSRLICFYTATKEISWILLTMAIILVLSRLLIRLLGTSMTFEH